MWQKYLLAISLIGVLAPAPPSNGVTAGDVLNRMGKEEQFGYITGAIDMTLFLEQVEKQGSTPRSACIVKWFYSTGAKGPRDVQAMFEIHQDKSAVGLIDILINRACGR